MKALKTIGAIVIAVILLACECAAMGFVTVDRALTEKNTSKAIEETGIVDLLTSEILAQNTVNMGGRYGEVAKAAMNSDAMRDFFAAYVTMAVRSQVYGDTYEEIGEDDLTKAFNKSMDQVKESGKYNFSPMEEEFIRRAMMEKIPDLTANLNSSLARFSTTDGQLVQRLTNGNTDIRQLMSFGTKAVAMALCIVLSVIIVAMYWRSKLGFIWCAVVTTLASLIYFALSRFGGGGVISIEALSAADQFAVTLLTYGFKAAAILGFVVAVFFVVLYIVFKIIDRRKTYEEDFETPERIA